MNDVDEALAILRAGIDRFYSEGMTTWSKDQINRALKGVVTWDHPSVQSALRDWEERGIIRVLQTDDAYIEILHPFPDDE